MSINHLITFVSGACVGGYLAYTYMEAVKDEQLRKERQEKRQVANRCLYVLKYGSDLYPETSSEDSITEQPTGQTEHPTGHTLQSTEQTGQQEQQEQLLSDNDTLNTSSEVKSDTTLSNKFGLYVSTNSFPVHAILSYSDVNSYEPTILKKDTTEPTPPESTPVQPTPVQTSFAPVSTSEEKTSLLTTIQHNQSTLLSTPVEPTPAEPTPTMATPSSTSTEIQSNAQKLESEEKAHTIYLMALEKLTR